MVFVSILENEPDQLRSTAEDIGRQLGVDVDFYGIYADDADEDVLIYHELVQRTQQADFVYLRCMGDINRFRNWHRFEKVLGEIRGLPAVFSGNPEMNLITRPIFRGSDEEYRDLYSYVKDRCPENDAGVVWWAMNRLGFTDKHPGAPIAHRSFGLYHPKMDADVTLEEYLSTLDPDRMTLGLVFPSNTWIYGTTEHVDAIIEEIENKGMNVISIFCSSFYKDDEHGVDWVLEHFFTKDGEPLVSSVIALSRLAIDGPGLDRCLDELNFYRNKLDVPVIFGLSVQGAYHDFEDDKIGLAKRDMQTNVIYPELEG